MLATAQPAGGGRNSPSPPGTQKFRHAGLSGCARLPRFSPRSRGFSRRYATARGFTWWEVIADLLNIPSTHTLPSAITLIVVVSGLSRASAPPYTSSLPSRFWRAPGLA